MTRRRVNALEQVLIPELKRQAKYIEITIDERDREDLYRLKKSEVHAIENHIVKLSVATFDATTEKKRSLWVPDNEQGDGTYYSYLSFLPENQM